MQHTSRPPRQYYRNGPPHRSGADVSFADLVTIFGFNSIHIGRWVTAAEQQQAANLFFDAFADLQQLLQVPAEVISLRGTLALTFGIGGQPGVCAFYQPQGRILALAKNAGGGSLAHEWFHAFDHYIANHLFIQTPPTQQFATRLWLADFPVKAHPLNKLLTAGFAAIFLDPTGTTSSQYFNRCQLYDQTLQQLYWAQPEELAARAFENMLQRQDLKNTFLVQGTLNSNAAKKGLYPELALSQQLTHYWLGYFKLLGSTLNKVMSAN